MYVKPMSLHSPLHFLRSLAHPHLSTSHFCRQRHDRNAIRVVHNGTTIGYVRTAEASKLALVLDAFRSYLHWTGTIAGGANAALKALNVSFYCREISLAVAVQGNLKRRLAGFSAADALASSRGPRTGHDFLGAESAVMSQLVASSLELSEKDWMEQKDALDELFDEQSRSQLANLPQYPMPALFVRNKVKLFRHQVAGIRWLVHQEKQDLPSYFESDPRNGRTGWKCKITKTRFANKPQGMKGGILADDMGLGTCASSAILG
jgi:SNF2-related domain